MEVVQHHQFDQIQKWYLSTISFGGINDVELRKRLIDTYRSLTIENASRLVKQSRLDVDIFRASNFKIAPVEIAGGFFITLSVLGLINLSKRYEEKTDTISFVNKFSITITAIATAALYYFTVKYRF